MSAPLRPATWNDDIAPKRYAICCLWPVFVAEGKSFPSSTPGEVLAAWPMEAPTPKPPTLPGTRKVCFAAGTPLLWEHGSKAIEEFKEGERVWARDEFNPYGPLELKEIEDVFVRFGRILHLHVGGQVIRTTGEHPFYVQERGWLPAVELQPGDLLSGHDGQWITVEEVYDTGEYETVYNMRAADFHTYFVGCGEWGFSVWAHNSYAEGDIDRYGNFNSTANKGDGLAGHELLQNAWLKAKGQTLKRGSGSASRDNPAMALGKELHKEVGAQQQALGLFNPANLKKQSATQNIALNAEAMVNTGKLSITRIQELATQSIQHAQNLGVAPLGASPLQQVKSAIDSAWILRDNIVWQ